MGREPTSGNRARRCSMISFRFSLTRVLVVTVAALVVAHVDVAAAPSTSAAQTAGASGASRSTGASSRESRHGTAFHSSGMGATGACGAGSSPSEAGAAGSCEAPQAVTVADEFWESVSGAMDDSALLGYIPVSDSPPVRAVPDLLSFEEIESVVAFLEERLDESTEAPKWCFDSSHARKLATLGLADVPPEAAEEGELLLPADVLMCVDGADADAQLRQDDAYGWPPVVVRVAPGENKVIDALERRLEREFGLPDSHSWHTELVVLRAGNQTHVNELVDCMPQSEPGCGVEQDSSTVPAEKRVVSLVTFLTAVPRGGQVFFNVLNLTIEPRPGMGLLWYSGAGKCDARTARTLIPPVDGDLVVLRRWYSPTYLRPTPFALPSDKNLTVSDGVVCADSGACQECRIPNARKVAVEHINEARKLSRDAADNGTVSARVAQALHRAAQAAPLDAEILARVGGLVAQEADMRVSRANELHMARRAPTDTEARDNAEFWTSARMVRHVIEAADTNLRGPRGRKTDAGRSRRAFESRLRSVASRISAAALAVRAEGGAPKDEGESHLGPSRGEGAAEAAEAEATAQKLSEARSRATVHEVADDALP